MFQIYQHIYWLLEIIKINNQNILSRFLIILRYEQYDEQNGPWLYRSDILFLTMAAALVSSSRQGK